MRQRPSIAERIRRLSARGSSARSRERVSAETLAERLGADLIHPGVARLERSIALAERHGRYRLDRCLQTDVAQAAGAQGRVSGRETLKALSDSGKEAPSEGSSEAEHNLTGGAQDAGTGGVRGPRSSQGSTGPVGETLNDLSDDALDAPALQAPSSWCFLDTETSGLAGGTGTWAFVVGIGQFTKDAFSLRQYLLLSLDAEPAMIEAVAAELAGAKQLISYNGKSFDLPLLETRFCLNGRRANLGDIPHLDLLHWVRRAFASRWGDCRLSTCEEQLLGVTRSDDLPGAEAPAAWRGWLQTGQSDRLGAVLRHNRTDLLSLATLIPALREVYRNPLSLDADLGAIVRHHVRQGRHQYAEALLERHRDALDRSAALLLAQLKRRRKAWTDAAHIWERLGAHGDPNALLALAKYHEHIRGDPIQALHYAQQLPPSTPQQAERCARLLRRIAGAAATEHRSDSRQNLRS